MATGEIRAFMVRDARRRAPHHEGLGVTGWRERRSLRQWRVIALDRFADPAGMDRAKQDLRRLEVVRLHAEIDDATDCVVAHQSIRDLHRDFHRDFRRALVALAVALVAARATCRARRSGVTDRTDALGGLDVAERPFDRFVPDVLTRLAREPLHCLLRGEGASINGGHAARYASGTIFPGLKMFCGSSAFFSARIASIASGPSSALRYFCLPWPMPCSPVQVPSIACARSTSRCMNSSPRAISSASLVSQTSEQWKLPSPTWPTIGDNRLSRLRSSSVSPTHSASREIGTQTSVATTPMLSPGRSAFTDQ